MEVIRTNLITKQFGYTKAADEISLHVKQKEIYGFLGLNGAGKTTLIRILLGMIKPDNGEVMLFRKRVTPQFDLWNEVGYLVETPYAYPNLSVKENLKVYYNLRQLNDSGLIDEIIARLKLTKYQHHKANVLSLGNQQRLGLAKALMHKPRLLILDEPINGLDPEGIVEVRELLKELADTGSTIFLSSHILGEISKVANRIGIIHEGRLVRELTSEELSTQLIRKLIVSTQDNAVAIGHITEFYPATLNSNHEIEIADAAALAHPELISKLLVERNLPPRQVYQFTEDLEMYFLRIIRNK